MASRVNVTTSVQLAPPVGTSELHGTYFLVGRCDRGPIVPTVVTSYPEFTARYGGRSSSGAAHDDLETFFKEGGRRGVFRRVVGSSPVLATLSLLNATPAAALRLDADSYGAWGNSLTATVTAASGERTITIGGCPDGVNEVFTASSNADLAAAINHQVSGSKWVTATVLNATIIAAAASASLASGTEDAGTINAASHTAALADFGVDLGSGVVAIPGQSSGVHAGLLAHAGAHRRIAVLCGAQTDSVATAVTTAAGQVAHASAEFGLYGFPWVKVPDGAGGLRTISPEGYIAAVRARAIGDVGPWRAPFGDIATARWVQEPSAVVSTAEFATLEAGKVSMIITQSGVTKLYGFRSLDTLAVFRLATVRDLMNYVAAECQAKLEQFVGRPIDGKGRLFAEVRSVLAGVLDPISRAGGLFVRLDTTGNQVDPGYVVNVGSDVNTSVTIAAGQVLARIGMRPSPAAEFLFVDVAAGDPGAIF